MTLLVLNNWTQVACQVDAGGITNKANPDQSVPLESFLIWVHIFVPKPNY